MNRKPPRRSLFHMLLSTLTRKAPEEVKQHVQLPRRPAPDDHAAWRAYWKEQGQYWRTEPEIDVERQKYLTERRSIPPNIEQGIYPFKDVKLSRADVEWLLATHESSGMHGPVNWNDENPQRREGLDLRGADLRQVNLSGLPLTKMNGGLAGEEWFEATEEQRSVAAVNLQEADLGNAQLQGAYLLGAQLQKAYLRLAQLQGAYLHGAQLQEADLLGAQLQEANLALAQLQGAYLHGAQLQGASLVGDQLQGANLALAQLQGADLRRADLEHAILDRVTFRDQTYGSAGFADISWGEVNLAVVDWGHVRELGDERVARQKKDSQGETKDKQARADEYGAAVRANRQLAIALRDQGLNEVADRFAYRAQVLQKTVFRRQMLLNGVKLRQRVQALGAWLFSWFLFLLAGYGYKPGRSFLAYLLVISTFAALYLLLDPCLAWYEAIVVSMTAFHGRGFSPSTFSPGDPLSIASAVEAFVGLIIEVTFIATLTRRFFGQ